MDVLLTALMLWAANYTGLPVPETPPTVKYVDSCKIHLTAFPDGDCAEDHLRATAIYDDGTMWLPDNVNWANPSLFQVSILLHEVVHHIQFEAGHTIDSTPCPGRDLERPAYAAQAAFLSAAGVEDPLKMMGLNGLTLHFLTSCRPIL